MAANDAQLNVRIPARLKLAVEVAGGPAWVRDVLEDALERRDRPGPDLLYVRRELLLLAAHLTNPTQDRILQVAERLTLLEQSLLP